MRLAVLTGVLLAASFPHLGHPLFAWIALAPLAVSVMQARSGLGAWRRGLVAGAVQFAGTIYWIPAVMVQFGGLPTVVAWLVHGALLSCLALFPSSFAWVLWMVGRRLGDRALLWTPAIWVTSELGRVHLFTGFPWELLGYSQTDVLPIAQLASLTGVLGVSALVALVNGAVAYGVCARRGRRWGPLAASIVLVVAVAGWGGVRLSGERLSGEGVPIRVGAVQGNIAQGEKWDPGLAERNMEKYLALTRRAAAAAATLIVWPEAATPFAFETDRRGQRIRDLATELDVHLLFGTTEVVAASSGAGLVDYYNAAALVDPRGATVGMYRKQHLVPWGEYVPLRDYLFFVSPLVESVGGFSAGRGPVLLPMAEGTVGTAICYEIIYPGLVRGLVTAGSQLLTTVTNDAWYGRTSAPHQHFQMARMRAIEQGRYLVRAANTGISGTIDPYGRVMARTALFEDAWLVGEVRLLDELTVYGRLGDVTGLVCSVLTALLLGVSWRARAGAGVG